MSDEQTAVHPTRRLRSMPRGALLGALAVVVFPWLPFVSFAALGSANLAAYYALVTVSLVVLTGWVGQISLGHAGLVGVGAYASGHVVNGWHLTFPVNLIWAGVMGAAVAAGLGIVALRVRGLYLAVATLIFSWMAAEYLFRQQWFTRNGSVIVEPLGEPGTFPFFDWTSRRTYFYAAWAVVAVAILASANLRDSKTGRAFFAVRGSEMAAASLGISVVRTKLTAFAVSGAMAAMAGNLLLIRDQVVTPESFTVENSLFFIAIAVVGGLASLGGAVASAVLFASLDLLFFEVEFFTGWLEVVPPLLLTAVLLLYRGGLAALALTVRRRVAPLVSAFVCRVSTELEMRNGRIRAKLRGSKRIAPPGRSKGEQDSGKDTSVIAEIHAKDEHLPLVNPRDRQPANGWLKERLRRNTSQSRRFEPPPRLDLDRALLSTGLVDSDTIAPATIDRFPQSPRARDRMADAIDEGDEHAREHDEHATEDGGVISVDWRTAPPGSVGLPTDRLDRQVILEAAGVTVRFGGLTAVDNVSLSVREHEIVGLIGPNGAGKTTTFNAIAGLNVPTLGRVSIYGSDVTSWSVDERARLGVGRTFQAVQLFPQLTVFDNLLVATHMGNPSGFLSHLFVGPSTVVAEAEARRRVRQVSALLELNSALERPVADLPFGVLRMVEVARALVTQSRLIMLDEPASGLDTQETERLADLLRFVRSLGVTLLLIEHDVQMVTTVSDYLYVLDQGRLLAEGDPGEVQRDPRVIAAYLGEAPTDEPRALAGARR